MRVIAFGHRRHVGKDTSVQYLLHLYSQHNKKAQHYSLAESVKDFAYHHFGCFGLQPGAFYDHPANTWIKDVVVPKLGVSPRDIHIALCNLLRSIHPAALVAPLFRDGVAGMDETIYLISDIRSWSEADYIVDHGGELYRIDNPNVEKFDDYTEVALEEYDKWTGVITNDRDFKHLYRQLYEISGL